MKNCPRCKSNPVVHVKNEEFWVSCTNCFTFSKPSRNKEHAVNNWEVTEEKNLYGTPLEEIENGYVR